MIDETVSPARSASGTRVSRRTLERLGRTGLRCALSGLLAGACALAMHATAGCGGDQDPASRKRPDASTGANDDSGLEAPCRFGGKRGAVLVGYGARAPAFGIPPPRFEEHTRFSFLRSPASTAAVSRMTTAAGERVMRLSPAQLDFGLMDRGAQLDFTFGPKGLFFSVRDPAQTPPFKIGEFRFNEAFDPEDYVKVGDDSLAFKLFGADDRFLFGVREGRIIRAQIGDPKQQEDVGAAAEQLGMGPPGIVWLGSPAGLSFIDARGASGPFTATPRTATHCNAFSTGPEGAGCFDQATHTLTVYGYDGSIRALQLPSEGVTITEVEFSTLRGRHGVAFRQVDTRPFSLRWMPLDGSSSIELTCFVHEVEFAIVERNMFVYATDPTDGPAGRNERLILLDL